MSEFECEVIKGVGSPCIGAMECSERRSLDKIRIGNTFRGELKKVEDVLKRIKDGDLTTTQIIELIRSDKKKLWKFKLELYPVSELELLQIATRLKMHLCSTAKLEKAKNS